MNAEFILGNVGKFDEVWEECSYKQSFNGRKRWNEIGTHLSSATLANSSGLGCFR